MSLIFNGTTDYINLGNVLPATSDMSICCWAKRNSSSDRMSFVAKVNDAPVGYDLYVQSNGTMSWGSYNGIYYAFANSTTTMTIGNVYHIVGVRDSSSVDDRLKIYINGVLEGTGYDDQSPANDTTNLNFGRQEYLSSGIYYLNGAIDDIRFYNRVLSANEILTIYNSRGKDKIIDNLIGNWKCNDRAPGSTGSILYDFSNNYNGTLMSGAVFGEGIF